MKLKIKVKKYSEHLIFPVIIKKGEWIDLRAAEGFEIKAPTIESHKVDGKTVKKVNIPFNLIPLGIAIKLPKGFEAVVLPRSSTYKNHGIIMANSKGVIDNSYCGDSDEWKFPALSLKDGFVNYNDRICQFRIQLSQKATVWQKLKWFLSSGIKLIEVESLGSNNRNGFGSTGMK